MAKFQKFVATFVALVGIVLFGSCTADGFEDTRSYPTHVDTIKIVKDHVMVNDLTHDIDTALTDKASDEMEAKMRIYNILDGEVVDSFSMTEYPTMDTHIYCLKDDYVITEEQIEPVLVSSELRRNYNRDHVSYNGYEEKDTLILSFNDGQVVSVPVIIYAFSAEVKDDVCHFGSDSLISAKLTKVQNINTSKNTTRATYVSSVLTTEYSVELTFAEKNTKRDSIFNVNLKTYVNRKVLSEDAIDKVEVINKNRKVIDETTEQISFDKMYTMKSGEVIKEPFSRILKREFKGIAPYEKYVSSFDYALDKSNGVVVSGNENSVEKEGNWNVFGKTDKYSANISNGIEAELIVTDYSLYHERAVYRDSHVEVAFGYENVEATEIASNVSAKGSDKEGFDKAVLNNEIRTLYLGYTQNLMEDVYLYQTATSIQGYDLENPKLQILDDKVIASIDFVINYTDGKDVRETDKIELPRSISCLTDWTCIEANSNQKTDTAIVVISASNQKSEGFWSYKNQTRNVSTLAHLNSSKQTNKWSVVVPNEIVYSREGKTYNFGEIEFFADENGADVVFVKEENGLSVYKYTDKLNVIYGENTVNTTAPGTIKVDGKGIKSNSYKDKKIVVNSNNVIASLTWITTYNDGTEKTESVSKTFPRELVCNTNWNSKEANANQTTGNTNVSIVKSEPVVDGNWVFIKETRSISTTAKLASSSQANEWTSIDPNSIVYTQNGVTVDFGTLDFSATKSDAKTTLESTVKNVETYSYVCTINVTFGSNSLNSSAPGTIIVEKAREVVDHEIRDPKLVVNSEDVTATLTWATIYNDGTEETESVKQSFARSLEVYTNWSSKENNATQTTESANTSLLSSNSKKEGFFTYVNETRQITTLVNLASSTQKNGWNSVDPNRIVYSREGKTFAFDKIEFSASEAGADVKLKNETANSSTYSYTDKINVVYGGNTKNSTATGEIIVDVVVSGYDITNPQLIINNDNVIAKLNWITKYSNGSETSEAITKTFTRSFNCYTNWSSKEANGNQNTGSATVSVLNTKAEKDGYWSWNVETRDIKTIANLNSSNQTNGWKSIDPNSIIFTREGKTYDFGKVDFNAIENGATTSIKSEDDMVIVYNYTDVINVSFGSNTFNSSATGTINVEKPWNPDFPADWGKFVKATATVSCNEDVKDWIYTWSLHFENGTLPVVVRRNANEPEINTNYFEAITDSRFNGGSYVNGKWVNSIASDESNFMLWTSHEDKVFRMFTYPTATAWKWNNGKNTVYTDEFNFELKNDGKVLVITKNGNEFARYKAGK